MFASVPHNPRLPVAALVLALLGLLALLVIPIVARHASDQLHNQIEDQVEPTHDAIHRAISSVYEIHTVLDELYFFPDQSSPQAVTLGRYQALVQDWRQLIAEDKTVVAGGPMAVQHWQSGVAILNQWLDRYGDGREAGNKNSDTMHQSNLLFKQGINQLILAQIETERTQTALRQEINTISRVQVSFTVPLAAICLLLALLFWRNLVSLRQSWLREQEANARLEVAIQETNHRIKNNLQVVSSLLDMQMLEAEETIPKAALSELVHQVKAIAAVHDFLSHEMRGSRVQGDRMLEKLVHLVAQPAGLDIRLEAESVGLEVKQATALALITNELLLNSGKHGATEAVVCIRMEEGNRARLQVADNGPGFPASFDPLRDSNLGIALVDTLTRHDLEGDVAFQTQNGALVEITFPLSSSPER
ncbi:MAG TPA: sensor histidine kinase [Chthonomonadaceae bacterium]|nr:sensor histidine kinase [Chthonomonadaceae bacterium]